MPNDFADFADAMSRSSTKALPDRVPDYRRFAVLGGGADARLLAALCLAEEREVTLFSAYGAELSAMRRASGIALRGAGPVGTYHVDRPTGPSVALTAELDAAVSGADVIFLTGPIHKQRTYAMVLADHLSDGQVLVDPEPDTQLTSGDAVIVLGHQGDLPQLARRYTAAKKQIYYRGAKMEVTE